jgi:thioredoxin 1
VSAVRDVTDETFAEVVLAASTAILVDFWAPWCRPCAVIEPILEELAESAGGRLRLARLDVDANLRTPAAYGVLSLPTVILFEHGEPQLTILGARGKRRYARELAPWLGQ